MNEGQEMTVAFGKHGYYFLRGLGAAAIVIAMAFSLPDKSHAQATEGIVIHIVSWGETVSSIAARYGVTVASIVARNHLVEANRIYAGQQLIIPTTAAWGLGENGDPSIHIVQPGENLYRISIQYSISIQALVAVNGLIDENQVLAGQRLVIPQPGTARSNSFRGQPDAGRLAYHTVQPGETLSGISQLYGVSVAALQASNSIINPSQIFAGQRLIVPGAADSVGPGYTPQQATITHIVQAGETLFIVANHYGVSVWVIAQTNSISDPSLIYPGQRLSIPVNSALSPSSATSGLAGKSVVVDVSEQRTYAYEDGGVIETFVVSTGIPGQDTMRGNFQIQNKIPVAYAATWDLQMPYWLGFYWAGPLQNGFHALPILSNGVRLWEGLLGRPASYGCVILSEEAAQWLYEWSDIGTPVKVQD